MSTTPVLPDPQQQDQPPPVSVNQQAYTAHSGHGSVGPTIAVLAVIAILGAIAVMIGRLCSGRRIMGYGQYDFEGWVEAKCSSCIDGRVDYPPPPPPLPIVVENNSNSSSSSREDAGDAVPVAAPAEANRERKPEEVSDQHDPHETAGS